MSLVELEAAASVGKKMLQRILAAISDETRRLRMEVGKMADLVILDVMFPEDSSAGFELARTMRLDNEDLKKPAIR